MFHGRVVLPENRLSTTAVGAELLQPDARKTLDTLDYEQGGIALSDPSQGLQVQTWVLRLDEGGLFYIYPENGEETLLFTDEGALGCSLAFDQNMRPVVAYEVEGESRLRWFDTVAGEVVTTSYANATDPRVGMDDKRDLSTFLGTNDVIFAYLIAGKLKYRQQRDRYTVEYDLGDSPVSRRLRNIGMGVNNRFLFLF